MTIHPTDQLNLWPLHQNSSVGHQLLAGSTLHDLQAEYARGLKDAHLPENAWVTKEDWQRLGELEAPAVLRSASGAPLSWTNDNFMDVPPECGIVPNTRFFPNTHTPYNISALRHKSAVINVGTYPIKGLNSHTHTISCVSIFTSCNLLSKMPSCRVLHLASYLKKGILSDA